MHYKYNYITFLSGLIGEFKTRMYVLKLEKCRNLETKKERTVYPD